MLKLNTIIRGDAPTSCITTGISKQIVRPLTYVHVLIFNSFMDSIKLIEVWALSGRSLE